MSARGRSVSTCAIIRTTRGIEPSISSSRAQISGTSPKPSMPRGVRRELRDQVGGGGEDDEMKSSTSRPLASITSSDHLGDPLEHVLALVVVELGRSSHRPDCHGPRP